jgi:hypothetical protein
MRDKLLLVLLAAVATGGCGTAGRQGERAVARTLLVGAMIAAGGTAAGAAVVSGNKESDLRALANAGSLTGRQFAERDSEGQRWNRIARGSAFVAGLAVVGLAILWEMTAGERALEATAPAPPGTAVARTPP